jgi:hypothetical protein
MADMRILSPAVAVAVLVGAMSLSAQSIPDDSNYSRKNTFGVFTAYSNDSSHILMGISEQRKLLNVGASYGRRLLENRTVNWQFSAEVMPVALESDPVIHQVVTFIPPSPFAGLTATYTLVPIAACKAGSGTISSGIVAYDYVNTCGRRWTIGEAMSPVGFQWNFRPRRKLQPYFSAHGGYMFSTQTIPVASAGSFNFTFDFGAGVELYRTRRQSVRAEFRFHHISNRDTADQNPGIDNGLFQVAYTFGR